MHFFLLISIEYWGPRFRIFICSFVSCFLVRFIIRDVQWRVCRAAHLFHVLDLTSPPVFLYCRVRFCISIQIWYYVLLLYLIRYAATYPRTWLLLPDASYITAGWNAVSVCRGIKSLICSCILLPEMLSWCPLWIFLGMDTDILGLLLLTLHILLNQFAAFVLSNFCLNFLKLL